MSEHENGWERSGKQPGQDRRGFLKASGSAMALGGITALAVGMLSATAAREKKPVSAKPRIARKQVILFQGDSITDAGRSRDRASVANDQGGLGSGYAAMAGVGLLLDHPGYELAIYNRGISGHKVFQLAERWEEDCLKLRPGLLSILIGVNDFWHTLGGGYKGTVETYERDYRALVQRTIDALPGVALVICEPFALRAGAVNDKWFPEFDKYRAASRRVADEFQALFVPYQLAFDRALKHAPADYWAKDGVHPSAAGAALMAHTWHAYVEHGGPR
ncbi:MAG: SGNH/GDSL hydrolase family protein [Verrucomicrobia bacterium]|nr:SGNH/GDSL hydrolase family protein [Verrucomicrobiota bacterium]MBI3870055.1 SGNH/GDSL hydrolase family protein [Verrucomicrobiota bacterium]